MCLGFSCHFESLFLLFDLIPEIELRLFVDRGFGIVFSRRFEISFSYQRNDTPFSIGVENKTPEQVTTGGLTSWIRGCLDG